MQPRSVPEGSTSKVLRTSSISTWCGSLGLSIYLTSAHRSEIWDFDNGACVVLVGKGLGMFMMSRWLGQ